MTINYIIYIAIGGVVVWFYLGYYLKEIDDFRSEFVHEVTESIN